MPDQIPRAAQAAESTIRDERKSRAGSRLALPIVVAAMTVLGGVVGVLVVAPQIINRREAAAAGETPAEDPAPERKGPVFRIDNLVVNPAGSQGTRFLMVSIAIETANQRIEEHLREREPQIRDVAISLLERQTMEALGQPGIRDRLKEQLADTFTALAKTRSRVRVFLPQFVIQ